MMDADEAARVRRGASASTSPDVLQALAKDPSVTVRASVALNPALPNHLTAVLAADADARVRAIIGRKLASLAPDLTEAARERAQQNAMANLTTPVADAALRVRANIAESVLMLFSPMLTQEDLVALIASGPPSTTLTAVARRSKISEAVSDALVETADVAAIGALLANHTAQIREVTLDALAAQSEEQTAWQEPLVRRPYLPPRAARILSEIVTSHLLETLAARTDLDPKLSLGLRTQLNRTPPKAPPGMFEPLEALAPNTTPQAALSHAYALRDAGRLDDQAVLDALRCNATGTATAMLAKADVPLQVVERERSAQLEDKSELFENDLEIALMRNEGCFRPWSWLGKISPGTLSAAALSLSAVTSVVFIGAFFLDSLWKQTISIQPLSVPKLVAENGFTPDVAALRLRDEIYRIVTLTHVTKRYHEVAQQTELPDVVVPSVGISIQALAAQICALLGIKRHQNISGELTIEGGLLFLTLRLDGKQFFTSQKGVEPRLIRDLMTDAGPAVLDATQPSTLGWLLLHLGERDEAMVEYRKAIELNPADAPSHHGIGVVLDSLGQHDEAIAELHKAIELDPKYAAAHANLGMVLNSLGQPDEAIAELHKAIELNPADAPSHHGIGVVLDSLGQHDEAIAEFHKAIELDPKYAAAHANLGMVLDGLGRHDEAIAELHKAIELDPKYAAAHANLGVVLNGLGRHDEAIAELHKAIELDPKLLDLSRLPKN